VERITTTIDAVTLAAIRRVAGRRGVSRFLQEAAKRELARLELIGLLDELDATHGRSSDEQRREIDRDARRIFRR
jgi:hypothetical protein